MRPLILILLFGCETRSFVVLEPFDIDGGVRAMRVPDGAMPDASFRDARTPDDADTSDGGSRDDAEILDANECEMPPIELGLPIGAAGEDTARGPALIEGFGEEFGVLREIFRFDILTYELEYTQLWALRGVSTELSLWQNGSTASPLALVPHEAGIAAAGMIGFNCVSFNANVYNPPTGASCETAPDRVVDAAMVTLDRMYMTSVSTLTWERTLYSRLLGTVVDEVHSYPGIWGPAARFAEGGGVLWLVYPTVGDFDPLVFQPLQPDGSPSEDATEIRCGLTSYDVAVLDSGAMATAIQCGDMVALSIFVPGEVMPPFIPIFQGSLVLPPAIADDGNNVGVLIWPSGERPRTMLFDQTFTQIGGHEVSLPRSDLPIGADLAAARSNPSTWAVAFTYADPGRTFVQRFEFCE